MRPPSRPFSFGPTDPARRPKPPGIFGYPLVSRRAARAATVAGGSAKCQQTRAFLLGSAWRVGSVAPRLKIVVSSVRFRVSPSPRPGAQAPPHRRTCPHPGSLNPGTGQPDQRDTPLSSASIRACSARDWLKTRSCAARRRSRGHRGAATRPWRGPVARHSSPTRSRSLALWRWSTRTTSWSIIGPSSTCSVT